MPSVSYRSWTYLDEERGEPLSEHDQARADGLARWWSELRAEDERSGWDRRRAYEDGDDCYYPFDDPGRRSDYDSEAEYDAAVRAFEKAVEEYHRKERAVVAEREEKMRYVEEELAKLGCRMERPYEHWNEDERWIQWEEEGKHGHYSY